MKRQTIKIGLVNQESGKLNVMLCPEPDEVGNYYLTSDVDARIAELESALRNLLDIGKGIGWFPGERWKWQKAAELIGEKFSL